MIKDSGNRTEFGTGAVRDIQKGKGRCDLMPLDVLENLLVRDGAHGKVLGWIQRFKDTGNIAQLCHLLFVAVQEAGLFERNIYNAFLEVSIHFEEGSEKYGENNWQKGIPVPCYINSAVRHYLKHLRGDTDERHDRAFVWNILCALWTCEHKPELNPYGKTKPVDYQE